MLKRILLGLLITTSCYGEVVVVQSSTVTDIYGFELLQFFPKPLRVLTTDALDSPQNRRRMLADLYTVINEETKEPELVVIGPYNLENTILYADVLTDFDVTFITEPVYVISDVSDIAAMRLAKMKSQVKVVGSYFVDTEGQLRNVLQAISKEKKGVIVINAFNIWSDWNRELTYYDIEVRVIKSASKNIVIGVCGPNTEADFSIGVVMRMFNNKYVKNKTTLCASIEGLRKWPTFVTVPHTVTH